MPLKRSRISPEKMHLAEGDLEGIAKLTAKHPELEPLKLMRIHRRKKWEAALSAFVGKNNLGSFMSRASEVAKQKNIPQHEAEIYLLEEMAARAFPQKAIPAGEIVGTVLKAASDLKAAAERMQQKHAQKIPEGKKPEPPRGFPWFGRKKQEGQ